MEFSLKFVEVDTVSSVQKSTYDLEVFLCEHSTTPRLKGVRVIGDTIATGMSKRTINHGLLYAKETAYALHIVPPLLKNRNSGLDILGD